MMLSRRRVFFDAAHRAAELFERRHGERRRNGRTLGNIGIESILEFDFATRYRAAVKD